QDRVPLVPQREREAQTALAVGYTEQAVLAPAIGAAPRVFVGEVGPCVAVGGIVLADRAPLPLGEVWPPTLPVGGACGVGGEALVFGSHRGGVSGAAAASTNQTTR